MKELVRDYLQRGISRRQLMSGLSAIGLSTVAAESVARSLTPLVQPVPASLPPMREINSTGGGLFVAQLKAAGIEYIFFNPSTSDSPIYDALIDEPGIQLIKGVQEGAVVAMADGYARASGKPAAVLVATIGLPNAMTQMVNSWKDQIPLVVAVASTAQAAQGRENFQEGEHPELMTQPITKWYWEAQSAAAIPETVRRGIKFATTHPGGPVFLALPANTLRDTAKAEIWDQAKFDVPMLIRPDKNAVEAAARLLIEAKNPLLNIGDEVTTCHAEQEVLQLAELLGLPVAGQAGSLGYWSKPFPTRHPLYLGPLLAEMRYPGQPDLMLNLGDRYGERAAPGTKLISVRLDPASLARTTPVDLGIVADLKLAVSDIIDAVRSMATAARLAEIAEARTARTAAFTAQMAEFRQKIAREFSNAPTISLARLAVELESGLDKDSCYVADLDSGKTMDPLMSFGGADKTYFSTSPAVLGWGMAAAFGVKLARPDTPVVSVVGDGSFLFSGPQPLWSMARYKAPVMVAVLNNRSYNNERNRIWNSGGKQFTMGRDMTCYLGSPDVDYAKASEAFGVQGEVVAESSKLKDAINRAKRAVAEGRPYLLDIHVERDGIGASSSWHPPYSIAELRSRKV